GSCRRIFLFLSKFYIIAKQKASGDKGEFGFTRNAFSAELSRSDFVQIRIAFFERMITDYYSIN
ncbi:MAG: hypothetical protein IJ719_23275, partial [Clostridia bacterium]|nr:hypothetical protein [Clostridia bacterium]